MGRRGRSSRGAQPGATRGAAEEAPPLNRPFAGLPRTVRALPPAPVPPPRPSGEAGPPPGGVSDEGTLFARAMDGVRRLAATGGERVGVARAAPPARVRMSEEAEALAALSDLVTGSGVLDVTETREYVEGLAVGVDARLVRRLRRGEFAWRAHLDLHGMTSEEARVAVERFLVDAQRAGHRCVLIVHGRGLNSKDRTPVLKERLKTWLAHTRLAAFVLAFATARACDGGAGALYVLLRRDRRRRPVRVTDGAKR